MLELTSLLPHDSTPLILGLINLIYYIDFFAQFKKWNGLLAF